MILALPARAKLNLELRVTGTRPDGEHEIDTLLQAIDLHDLVEVGPAGASSLEVTGLPAPSGQENLASRAVAALEEHAARPLPARLRLTKRIPAGAGLGGGSSDAAAVLAGVARLYGLEVDLHAVAARLGADVPFFLRGGRARARGRGDVLSTLPTPTRWYALAWPGFAVSTGAVYRAWDDVGGEAPNDLSQAAQKVEPRLDAFAARLGEGWQMTGSGSAFFRACPDQRSAEGEVSRLDCWAVVARSVPAWTG